MRHTLAALIICLVPPAHASAQSILHVPSQYPTIQAAIDAAAPGDTVTVAPGTYVATNAALARIDKPLTLEGSGHLSPAGTILDGGTYGTLPDFSCPSTAWCRGIEIHSNNVTVRNLRIQNFMGAMVNPYWGYGIMARGDCVSPSVTYSGIVLQDITILNARWGVRLYQANNVVIERVTFKKDVPAYAAIGSYAVYGQLSANPTVRDCVFEGSCWLAPGCINAQILDNTITDAPYNGIWLGMNYNNAGPNGNAPTVSGNTICGVFEGGIVLWNSPVFGQISSVTITDNTVTGAQGNYDNHGAISIYPGNYTNVTITGNNCSGNLGDQAGLKFRSCTLSAAVISDNQFSGNLGPGILLDRVTRTANDVHINNNSLYGNTMGLSLSGGSGPILDATGNWWGDATGPFNTALNPQGLGNAVSDGVDFSSPLPGPVGCTNEACLNVIEGSELGAPLTLLLQTTIPSAPCYVFGDIQAGSAPLITVSGVTYYTQLAYGPNVVSLADPSATFGPSLTTPLTDANGEWTVTLMVPNDPALLGLNLFAEAYSVFPTAAPPFGVFRQSNLAAAIIH